MDLVPEHVVKRTWDRMAEIGLRDARALMRKAGPFQEELVGFALGFTHDLGPDGGGLAMYMTLMVLEMFRELGETHIGRVDEDAITLHLELNEDLLAGSPGNIDGLVDMVAVLGPMKERFVMRCVTDTLAQASGGDDPFDLTTAEICHVFLVLKTIVDCLHESCDWSSIEKNLSQMNADAG